MNGPCGRLAWSEVQHRREAKVGKGATTAQCDPRGAFRWWTFRGAPSDSTGAERLIYRAEASNTLGSSLPFGCRLSSAPETTTTAAVSSIPSRLARSFGGLYLRVVAFALLLILMATVFSTAVVYTQQKQVLLGHLQDELLAIAQSSAAMIDAGQVELIQPGATKGEILGQGEFEEVESTLERLTKANSMSRVHGSPIYIVRRGSVRNGVEQMQYVAMTEKEPDGTYSVGYEDPMPSVVRQVLTTGRSAVSEIYNDAQGAWISAAVPIKKKNGGTITAVLLADRHVEFYIAKARRTALGVLAGAILSFLVAAPLALIVGHSVVVPIRRIAEFARSVGAGQFDQRVPVDRSDELGDLALNFNRMAEQLKRSGERIEQQKSDLIDAHGKAEAGSRAKSEFLATMSHEIRTPMNAILGFIDLLLDSELTTEQRRNSEFVKQSASALLGILNDILDISRLEAGKMTLEQRSFNLREVVRNVTELMTISAHKKGIKLLLWIEEGVPNCLEGDAMRLRQVLLNLVSNAVKFTERGEVSVRVFLTNPSSPDEVGIRFEVRDTGIGIPPELLGKLFQPFSQADGSTTRRFGGTGLGLVICKKFIELMGGQVGVESGVGRGTQFWFTLGFRSGMELVEDLGLPPIPGYRVLVVGEIRVGPESLPTRLRSWMLDVDVVESAGVADRRIQEAVEQGNPFDVAVIDLESLGQSGGHSSGLLVGSRLFAGPSLIVLSSSPDSRADQLMREDGLGALLLKPVKQLQLHHALVEVIRRRPKLTVSSPLKTGEAPLRILLAEDHEVNRLYASELLHRLGFHPEVAGTGNEVLKAAAGQNYDVILMDCLMPELDGYETTRRLRERERGGEHRTWIIALTANAMREDRNRCLAAGMDDYLAKPFGRDSLRIALERAREGMSQRTQTHSSRAS